jgi:hypothetical protein
MALYVIVYFHAYAYFNVCVPAMKTRLGEHLTVGWSVIGVAILYNICFNHFFAMIVKPGNPTDLIKVEELRRKLKNREGR